MRKSIISTCHVIIQLLGAGIGTVFLGVATSFLLGTMLLSPIAVVAFSSFEQVTARRVVRACELLTYWYAGTIHARYSVRFLPLPAEYGAARHSISQFITLGLAIGISIYMGVIGMRGPRAFHFLLPVMIFCFAFGRVLNKRYFSGTPLASGGTLLFLRRFNTFADRSLVVAVLGAAPASANVSFLIPSDESVANWDPFVLGYSGFRPLHPFSSIPVYYESCHKSWAINVSSLMTRAKCIVMDLSQVSDSIGVELRLLTENKVTHKTLFLVDASVPADALATWTTMHGLDYQDVAPRIVRYRLGCIRTMFRACAAFTVLIGAYIVFVGVALIPKNPYGVPWTTQFELNYGRSGAYAIYAVLILTFIAYCRAIVLKAVLSRKSICDIRSHIQAICRDSTQQGAQTNPANPGE